MSHDDPRTDPLTWPEVGEVAWPAGEVARSADATRPDAPEPGIDAFKAAMRLLAAGVVMVTTRVHGRPWGLTVSSCISVAVSPPNVLVSLARATASRHTAVESGRYGVSLLRTSHKRLAEVTARPGTAKFIDGCLGADRIAHGVPAGVATPVVAGALYHLDCLVAQTVEVSDHTLLIGKVEHVLAGAALDGRRGQPLVYVERAFRHLGERIE